MKTARQVLLDRHAGAQPELNVLRQSVVAPLRGRRPWLGILWQELVLPIRPLLAGLSVVWVLMLVLHLSTRESSSNGTRQPVAAAVAREVASQQRILSALLGLRPEDPVEATPPRLQIPPSGQVPTPGIRTPRNPGSRHIA